jgi:hypothetical protein
MTQIAQASGDLARYGPSVSNRRRIAASSITNLDTAQTDAAQLPYVAKPDSIILLRPLSCPDVEKKCIAYLTDRRKTLDTGLKRHSPAWQRFPDPASHRLLLPPRGRTPELDGF